METFHSSGQLKCCNFIKCVTILIVGTGVKEREDELAEYDRESSELAIINFLFVSANVRIGIFDLTKLNRYTGIQWQLRV